MRAILKEMQVSREVKSALLDHTGLLGELLVTVKAMEHFDIPKVEAFIEAYSLTYDAVAALMMQTSLNNNQ